MNKADTQYETASASQNRVTLRDTAARRRWELMNRLTNLGFSYDEAETLRRIQMTFHRWDEAECGDGNDYASWSIERNEETNIPYRCVYPHSGNSYKTQIADREAGAQRRLDKIMARHPELIAYHQGDCRGCALYIVRRSDLPIKEVNGDYAVDYPSDKGTTWYYREQAEAHALMAFYTRGVAVCD